MYNFSLDIFEYYKSDMLISRKQYYIDVLKPEYSILEVADSCLDTKQTKELISKALRSRLFL